MRSYRLHISDAVHPKPHERKPRSNAVRLMGIGVLVFFSTDDRASGLTLIVLGIGVVCWSVLDRQRRSAGPDRAQVSAGPVGTPEHERLAKRR